MYLVHHLLKFHLQANCILTFDLRRGWQELGSKGVSGSMGGEALFAARSAFQGWQVPVPCFVSKLLTPPKHESQRKDCCLLASKCAAPAITRTLLELLPHILRLAHNIVGGDWF